MMADYIACVQSGNKKVLLMYFGKRCSEDFRQTVQRMMPYGIMETSEINTQEFPLVIASYDSEDRLAVRAIRQARREMGPQTTLIAVCPEKTNGYPSEYSQEPVLKVVNTLLIASSRNQGMAVPPAIALAQCCYMICKILFEYCNDLEVKPFLARHFKKGIGRYYCYKMMVPEDYYELQNGQNSVLFAPLTNWPVRSAATIFRTITMGTGLFDSSLKSVMEGYMFSFTRELYTVGVDVWQFLVQSGFLHENEMEVEYLSFGKQFLLGLS